MSRLSILTLSLLSVLAACDTQGDDFDDVEAIAAAKVEVCHTTNGTYGYTLIDVAQSSVDSHLAHGDTLFADDTDCNGAPDPLSAETWSQCLEDYNVDNMAELQAVAGYGVEALQCACDCSLCSDCGTGPLTCPCAPAGSW